jgi:hypothetical protein
LVTAFKEKESFVQTKCKSSLLNPFQDRKEALYKEIAIARK